MWLRRTLAPINGYLGKCICYNTQYTVYEVRTLHYQLQVCRTFALLPNTMPKITLPGTYLGYRLQHADHE